MKNLLMILLSLGLMSSCTRVNQGELGIVSHFNGSVEDETVGPGFHTALWDSIETIDATEVRVSVAGVTPKDKDGVLVTTTIMATYKVHPDKAAAFYKQTHEIDKIKENGSYNTVLGYQVLEQEITNSTQKAFSEFYVSDMVPKKGEMETRLKQILQDKLNSRYDGVFIVNNVNINETKLGETVERVLQSQAIAKSQRQLLELQQQLAEKESELISKKIEGLKGISQKTGIPVEKLMDYKLREQYNTVLSELSKNNNNTQIQVNPKTN